MSRFLIPVALLMLFVTPAAAQLWPWGSGDYSVQLPILGPANPNLGSIERGYSCKTKLSSFIDADTATKKVNLIASKNEEDVAIKIDRAKNEFCLKTAASLKTGILEGACGLKIVEDSERYIVAMERTSVGIESVMFDKTNRILTWTKNVEGNGVSASANYLECQ